MSGVKHFIIYDSKKDKFLCMEDVSYTDGTIIHDYFWDDDAKNAVLTFSISQCIAMIEKELPDTSLEEVENWSIVVLDDDGINFFEGLSFVECYTECVL